VRSVNTPLAPSCLYSVSSLLVKTSSDVSQILIAQVKSLEEVQKITGIVTEAMAGTIDSCRQAAKSLKAIHDNTRILITVSDDVNEIKELLHGELLTCSFEEERTSELSAFIQQIPHL